MCGKVVQLLVLVSLLQYTVFAKTSTVACYFNNWTVYRTGLGQFKVLNIDTNLCTHIFYTFEGISPDGTFRIIDEWGDINLNQIQDIISLKQKKPDLKILVSVGGYGAASANFRDVVASGSARANLIATSLAAINKYGFDGLDIVWEYPTTPADKENFARLVQEASTTFKIHNLLLTAAVAPAGGKVTAGYDVPVLSKNLDMISLMEYDFHGYYDGYTGSNAPLYYSSLDPVESDKENNVNKSVNLWITLGADPQKLVLGIPFYGKSYKLSQKNNNGLGAPVTGPGPRGHYTQQDGVLGYNEICELQMDGGWTIVLEPNEKVPYMYKDDTWISYDNVQSINSKVQYAKDKNLQGLSVWALGTDDFHGTCGKSNILLNAVNDALVSYPEVLEDAFDDLVLKLQTSFYDAVGESHKNVASAIVEMTSKTATLQRQLQIILKNAVSSSKAEIRGVIDIAGTYNVSIEDCLIGKVAELDNLSAKTLSNYTKCSNVFVLNTYERSDNVTARLKQLMDQVDSVIEDVKNCRNSTDSASCLKTLSTEVNKDSITIPIDIQNITKTVQDYVNESILPLNACEQQGLIDYRKKALDLLDNITICALNKINQKY